MSGKRVDLTCLRDPEWVLEMAKNHTHEEISVLLGTTRQTVTYWHNLHTMPRPWRNARDIPMEELKQVRAGNNYRDSALILGCSINSLKHVCRKKQVRRLPYSHAPRHAEVRMNSRPIGPPKILENAVWLRAAMQRSTPEEIAHTLSCPPALVREALQKIV
jgi:hypothetical protein